VTTPSARQAPPDPTAPRACPAPPGKPAPTGPQGEPGLADFEVVRTACKELPSAPSHGYDSARCSSGKMALGGGVGMYSDSGCNKESGEAVITYSAPNSDGRGWTGDVVLTSAAPTYWQVQVTCASVP